MGRRRTGLTAAASPVILVLDATAVTAVLLAAPALTWTLGIAVTASLTRIACTAWVLSAWLTLPLGLTVPRPGRGCPGCGDVGLYPGCRHAASL